MDKITCWYQGKCIGIGIIDTDTFIKSRGDTFEYPSHFFDVCLRSLYSQTNTKENVGTSSRYSTKQNKIHCPPPISKCTSVYRNLSEYYKRQSFVAAHASLHS